MIMTENERYTERVRDAFENFLVSKFIEYKPFSITDDRIIADAKDRSIINYDGGLLQWMQSFVSIMTVEGSADMEYNGNKFKQLILKASDGNLLRVNYSDFQYYTSFYKGRENSTQFGYDYDDSNSRYINLLDGKLIDPDSLAANVGAQILMGYRFNTVNRYGKLRTCYRFYSLSGTTELDAKKIRDQILRAQALSLLIAAKYPVLCLPSYNRENLHPYMYDITKETGTQYATRIRTKLREIEQVLREHGLTYEYSI